jgi:hypothetical protein
MDNNAINKGDPIKKKERETCLWVVGGGEKILEKWEQFKLVFPCSFLPLL